MSKVEELTKIRDDLLNTFNSGKTRSYEYRMSQLRALKQFLIKEEGALVEALHQDLHRPPFEGACLEIGSIHADLDEIMKNLKKWMHPEVTPIPAVFAPAKSEIHYDPFGVCLLICPFNYPIILALGPLIGAIAGGNCAVIKPSEMTVACERVLNDLLPKYLDNECYRVVCGDASTNQMLLKLRWDKIFFTGSTRVGKIVMKAAAEHLTPVSLELGGKTPVIIDEHTVSLETAAKRIVWGKGVNAGQTCMAPDYCFVHDKVYDEFLALVKKFTLEMYTANSQDSPFLSRPINQLHYERLKGLIEDSREELYCGGRTADSDRFVEISVFKDVRKDSKIMQEEIFGPLLPTLRYCDINEVIRHIVDGEKPLALYIFSSNKKLVNRLIAAVPSGGVVVNDVIFQFGNVFAPFGGIGQSGMGGYHGRFSFEDFTFKRAVLHRDGSKLMDIYLRYPPYSKTNEQIFKFAIKLPAIPPLPSPWKLLAVGATVAVGVSIAVALGSL
jgi:acyl-CoA reductase-like NAD-dependent aldehyde dehydrogenase